MIKRSCDWHEDRLRALEQSTKEVTTAIAHLEEIVTGIKTELLGIVIATRNAAARREKILLIVITALIGGIVGQGITLAVKALTGG